MAERNIVIGVFEDRAASTEAIQDLKEAGFTDKQIGFVAKRAERRHKRSSGALGRSIVGGIMGGVDMLILPFTGPADAIGMLEGTLPVAEEAMDRLATFRSKPAEQQENAGEVEETEDEDTDGNEGESTAEVTAGSITGGIVGAVGAALLLPGIGPAIAGGALTVALAGAAVGGIAGGLLGAFARIGVSREKAKYYEREFKAGNVILTVTAHDQAQEARASEILQSHGAHDVASHSK